MKFLFPLPKIIPSLILFACGLLCSGQDRTVGLLVNEEGVTDGYVLYVPINYTDTYLINNCGQVINVWQSDFLPGLAGYLDNEANLVRSGNGTTNQFQAAGRGGIIEKWNWRSELLYRLELHNDNYCQHHDIELLPNGNILAILWERIEKEEAIDNGRNPALIRNEIWSEKIVEIKPILPDSFEVVWEWRLMDHIIQDFDSTRLNFGEIASHPKKIDFNYASNDNRDWVHINSIDYSLALDQIVLSPRNYDEIWVIDHSITSSEASTEKGDLLFRWGNPATTRLASGKLLDGQHDIEFVEDGAFLLFNNNSESGIESSILKIFPEIDASGNYMIEEDTFKLAGPPEFLLENREVDISSDILSNIEIMENGNIFVNSGARTDLREFSSDGELLWHYKGTVSLFGPILQGAMISGQCFRADKYKSDDVRFLGKDLSIKAENIELQPLEIDCSIGTSVDEEVLLEWHIRKDAQQKLVEISTSLNDECELILMDMNAQKICSDRFRKTKTFCFDDFATGIYVLCIKSKSLFSAKKIFLN